MATPRIAFEFFGGQEVFCAVLGEEFGAETNLCCEVICVWVGVCDGERIPAVVGFFAGDDEFQLEAVAAVTAGAGLYPAVHFVGRFAVGGFKIMLEASEMVRVRLGWLFCEGSRRQVLTRLGL